MGLKPVCIIKENTKKNVANLRCCLDNIAWQIFSYDSFIKNIFFNMAFG